MAATQSRGSAQVCSAVPAVLVCLPQSLCQPPGCQPAASRPGPAPCRRRALDPTAPGSHPGHRLSRTTLLRRSLPLLGVGQSSKAWGGHCCSLGCHTVLSPCITPWGGDLSTACGVPTWHCVLLGSPPLTPQSEQPQVPPAARYTLTQLPLHPVTPRGCPPSIQSPRAPGGTCPGGKGRGRCRDPGSSQSR